MCYVRNSSQREVVEVYADQLRLLVKRLIRVGSRHRKRKLNRKIARRQAPVVHRRGKQQQRSARVVNTGVSPNHSLAIALRIPCESKTRSELLGVVVYLGRVGPVA